MFQIFIAPNFKVVLGQTHKKNIYGQIYANEIVIHQFSNLQTVPFVSEQTLFEYAYGELKTLGGHL